MSTTFRQWFLPDEKRGIRSALWLFVALACFVITFAAYALGVFTISGGIVWIPGDAALIGAVIAVIVGYTHGGFLAAWLVTYASLLGYKADHAFLGLSSRSFPEQFAYFIEVEGLVVLGIQAIVIGTIALVFGSVGRWGREKFKERMVTSS